MPPAASLANPVDILAGSGPATYALCLDALLRDETVDAVIVITAPQDWFEPLTLAEIVADLSAHPAAQHKPLLTAIMGPGHEAAHLLRRHRIPNFELPEHPGSALGAMWWRKQWLDSSAVESVTLPDVSCHRESAAAIVADQCGWLPPQKAEGLLNAYNIATPDGGLASIVDEALDIARRVGYPVALKLTAQGVTHKSDVDGVMLNIETPNGLRRAFDRMMTRAREHLPGSSDVEGAYVQQMVPGVVEIIVGVVRDPQFGPLVMAGSGGTQVELRGDVAFELAPLTREQAGQMLDRTGAGRWLAGGVSWIDVR